MQFINEVSLLGALGRDPEVRNTQAGKKVVSFSLATTESWNDKQSGERKQVTQWHQVVVMNDRLADVAERYLRKGSKVFVKGALQYREYADKTTGEKKSRTEVMLGAFDGKIVLLDSAGSGGDRQEAPRRGKQYAGPDSDMNDEIPF